jgi:monoamine oxidase
VNPEDLADGALAAALDIARLSDLVLALQLSPVARVVIGREVRSEFMLGPDDVSQLMAGWMTALHLRSGDGREAYRIAGGNDLLAHGLAAQLGDRVRLSTAVDRFDADTGVVEFLNGEVMTARNIIVTVPLPVLGRMWADMPPELAAVGYGIGGKVSVQVGRRVWNDHGCDGSVVSDRAWGQMWETSDRQPGDTGVLTILLSSHDGAVLAALPDTAARVIDEADRLFPGLKGLSGERVLTDWTNDRFSLGCYATFGPGELLNAWPLLQRRHGRVTLAGEHTDTYAGFMEGALRSGIRAAAQM